MKHISSLPIELQAAGNQALDAIVYDHQSVVDEAQLPYLFSVSNFVARVSRQYPAILNALIDPRQQQSRADKQTLSTLLQDCDCEESMFALLRQYRHLHMALITYRDLVLQQSIEDSLLQVSQLADIMICCAYDWLYRKLCARYGTPMSDGTPQPMHIIGMGKLGGQELNFSSDIDLIFCYPMQGQTEGARKSIENQTFFIRLGQKLIASLNQITEDGQVYRVDMRLRPLGNSGPLAIHHAALEDYYQTHGRQWERYAMVKARILNPEPLYSRQLEATIQPFIYRRYIDYTSIDALRDMKRMIKQEVRRRGLIDNIKLGEGGIREAEFIVQSFQLIRGGKVEVLRTPSFVQALAQLLSLKVLTKDEHFRLTQSYMMLRKVEHCLQQFDDQQTQTLPLDSLNKQRLITLFGCDDYDSFYQLVTKATVYIRQQFNVLIGEEKQIEIHSPHQRWIDLWMQDFIAQDWQQRLLEHGSPQTNVAQLTDILEQAHQQSRKRAIGERGALLAEKLYPITIAEVLDAKTESSEALMESVLGILLAICGRTAYLDLLVENPGARQQLIRLCNASPFISRQLSKFPLLLDELVNPTSLYTPTPPSEYPSLLQQFMLRVDPEDLEWQMESLRQFKLSQQLKVAAMDITRVLTVMEVSDHLTYLAESLLIFSIDIAWQQMAYKYGTPEGTSDSDKGLLAVAYGKFGGIELGYGSDLDMVFLHQSDAASLTNGGRRSIETGQFYQRLVQRVVHILHTVTHSGKMYEVDLRLRPQGGSGLLVCHLLGFAKYQQQDAWTWEHQALTRARCVYGGGSLRGAFNQIRRRILCQSRTPVSLRSEVVKMRAKMTEHLLDTASISSRIKHQEGGIVSIEFLTQYWILQYGHQYPELTEWSDNVRLLALLATIKCIPVEHQTILTDAYLWFREQAHQLSLQRNFDLDEAQLNDYQQQVKTIWQVYFND